MNDYTETELIKAATFNAMAVAFDGIKIIIKNYGIDIVVNKLMEKRGDGIAFSNVAGNIMENGYGVIKEGLKGKSDADRAQYIKGLARLYDELIEGSKEAND
jgi:hypothetical protein